MKPNPGGQLDPGNIVGRDDLVTRMWEILDGRSIYMNDVRRVGKTQVLIKLKASAPVGWLVISQDLGGYHTTAEFSTWVFRESYKVLSGKKRAFHKMAGLLGQLKGMEIAGVLKLPSGAIAPWKEVLIRTFSDLEEQLANQNERLVFLWDEVPFLLDNIAKREGADSAMQVLDILRSLSQTHPRIRFVLTGSVGLHHVLNSLRAEGYAGSPLNHMERIAPGPLAKSDAHELASQLLRGANVPCRDLEACAATAAETVGNVPFYIHKLVAHLPKTGPASPETIEATLAKEIAHPDSDWDLSHFRQRIPLYYGKDDKLVLAILDVVAAAEVPIALAAIRRGVSSKLAFDDDELLRRLLDLLQKDHYFERDTDGNYAFRFPLVRRWWRFDRSLVPATS
jgi:hypothetical protein